ncbi:hypothetical protein AVEN_254492-1 [Araneus ventricosus]|uniref:Uncharacterized protein n=1 Tax=Araneus ventricosus TaxID=182803 RepID=A0A4Y2LTW4_ARAVE|nr:hypothetical protein AVEN_254492-1 [Araneus ventricosus]
MLYIANGPPKCPSGQFNLWSTAPPCLVPEYVEENTSHVWNGCVKYRTIVLKNIANAQRTLWNNPGSTEHPLVAHQNKFEGGTIGEYLYMSGMAAECRKLLKYREWLNVPYGNNPGHLGNTPLRTVIKLRSLLKYLALLGVTLNKLKAMHREYPHMSNGSLRMPKIIKISRMAQRALWTTKPWSTVTPPLRPLNVEGYSWRISLIILEWQPDSARKAIANA